MAANITIAFLFDFRNAFLKVRNEVKTVFLVWVCYCHSKFQRYRAKVLTGGFLLCKPVYLLLFKYLL